MTKTILRLNHFMKELDFKKFKEEWERENPDTTVIPFTMKVEHTKARWIYKKDEDWANGGYYLCSNCRYKWSDYYDIDLFNYCPHCGAEIEAEE